MPDLRRVLQDYDPGLLRVIAGHWGLQLEALGQREAAEALALHMLQPDRLVELIASLPAEARAALETLARDGRLPLAPFMRRHGELRAMGPARRDREQPWDNAPSTTEALWYRGLIASAFFDEGPGPQEFVFVPDDVLALAPRPESAPQSPAPPGHARAHLPSPGSRRTALDLAPDDAVTLLAYLQVTPVRLEGASFPPKHREALRRFLRLPDALDLALHLAIHLGLIGDSPLKVEPARARPFLEAAHPVQTQALARAWRESREWNDLLHVPGLVFEGQAWRNDPLTARQAILNVLAEVPAGVWWSLDSFVSAVKERHPDFQRPAGDYDSWYIRDAATDTYLRGFENWERVDGALVRWTVEHPVYWLGLVEVGVEDEVAFRLTPYGAAFLERRAWPEAGPPAPIAVSAGGILSLPASASAYDRFQLARVSDWLPLADEGYRYRLTPAALARAARKGIGVSRIVAYLEKATGEAVPPALVGALHRWERNGGEAAVKDTVVLQLRSADLLQTLLRTPAVKRFLGESVGPAAVEVRREDIPRLREAMGEVGILVDD